MDNEQPTTPHKRTVGKFYGVFVVLAAMAVPLIMIGVFIATQSTDITGVGMAEIMAGIFALISTPFLGYSWKRHLRRFGFLVLIALLFFLAGYLYLAYAFRNGVGWN